jgi:SAM-dependent methyltransferase
MKPSQYKDVWIAAALYESYVGRWSRSVAGELLKWLSIPIRKDWLDVGSGTGALSQVIFEHGLPNAIKGIDTSADFIAYAKVHVDSARVTFEVGDAQALPMDSARFDVVVSGLVLNFMPEPQRAVAEMARVARPGGAVVAYVWDYADKMELMRYFWDVAVVLDPTALEFDEGRRFPICRPSSLAELFRDAGLQKVSAPHRHPYSLSRFRRLLVAVFGRARPSAGLCHVAERRAPRGAPETNSFEPSNCQGWIDTFNGSGLGHSWTNAVTLSASRRRSVGLVSRHAGSFSVGADVQDFAQRGVLAYLDPERLGAWSVIEAAASSEKAREQSAPAGPRGGARITLLPPVSCAPMLAHISRRFRCVPRRRKTRTEVTVFTEG